MIPTLDTMTKFVIMILCLTRNLCSKGNQNKRNNTVFNNTSRDRCFGFLFECFGYLLENKYPKHMFCEGTRIKQAFSDVSFCCI